jgi:S-adenosylmethionine/arginine decarboxylase-like enzyme
MIPVRFLIAGLVSSSWISFLAGRVARDSLWTPRGMDSHHDTSFDSTEVCYDGSVGSTASWKQHVSHDHTTTWNRSSRGLEAQGKENNGRIGENNDDEDASAMGEHLVLDFYGVDQSFLSSKESLLEAMVDFTDVVHDFDIGRSICHEFSRTGTLVCGGISYCGDHIWIHSRPKDTVLMIDIYTVGKENKLVSLVPTVDRIFGRPIYRDGMMSSNPSMRWFHKFRGFQEALDEALTLSMADLQWSPVGMIVDYKKEVRHHRKGNFTPPLLLGSISDSVTTHRSAVSARSWHM